MNTSERFSGEWETKRLGEIGTIYGGLSGKSKVDFGGGNARYVTFLGVLENIILDVRHTEHVHVSRGESQNSVLKGDMLFNASSETPGDLAIGAVMGEQLDNLYLNSFCFGFRIQDKNEHVPLFLAYFFRASVGRDIMNSLAQGATRYNMSKSQFRSLELSIPSGDEQRAIAKVLSDVDGLINALDALIAKKRAIKQATMQQLLTGKTRLPGFSGAWEAIRMGQIGSIYGGLSGKTKIDFEGGNARYVTFLGVLENVILDVRYTESVHIGQGESQNFVMKNDLLFNASSETPGDLAIGAVMGEQLDNLYLNSFCFGFRIHDKGKYVPLFLAYFFRGNVGRDIMNALAQGATRYNLSKSQFRALELSIPSGEEQRAIATVLSDMDTEIAALEHRRHKTIAIKQGIMQQLLTGKVRLSESRICADDAD